MSYVELHCHSSFSFLDGASAPGDLAARALALGAPALALTDHDTLAGAMVFAQAATALGIHPITGAEVTLENGAHLTLLVWDRTGYGNLCRLLSAAHLGNPKGFPQVSLAMLERHSQGLRRAGGLSSAYFSNSRRDQTLSYSCRIRSSVRARLKPGSQRRSSFDRMLASRSRSACRH